MSGHLAAFDQTLHLRGRDHQVPWLHPHALDSELFCHPFKLPPRQPESGRRFLNPERPVLFCFHRGMLPSQVRHGTEGNSEIQKSQGVWTEVLKKKNEFSEFVEKFRKTAGLKNQKAVAAALEMNESTLSQGKRDNRSVPVEAVIAWCEKSGRKPEEFLTPEQLAGTSRRHDSELQNTSPGLPTIPSEQELAAILSAKVNRTVDLGEVFEVLACLAKKGRKNEDPEPPQTPPLLEGEKRRGRAGYVENGLKVYCEDKAAGDAGAQQGQQSAGNS